MHTAILVDLCIEQSHLNIESRQPRTMLYEHWYINVHVTTQQRPKMIILKDSQSKAKTKTANAVEVKSKLTFVDLITCL